VTVFPAALGVGYTPLVTDRPPFWLNPSTVVSAGAFLLVQATLAVDRQWHGAVVAAVYVVVAYGLVVCVSYDAYRRQRLRAAGRRRLQGRCVRCDYDLTGNVSGVCPECGERVA
jgi:hypothetical protein